MKVITSDEVFDLAVSPNQTILDVLRMRYGITSPCGGRGICGKCKVKVLENETDNWKEALACKTNEVFAVDATELIDKAFASALIQENYKSGGTFFPKDLSWKGYSVAIDVGTTTLVASLIDGKTGSVVVRTSALNPQSSFGSDVISRIAFSLESEESKIGIQRVLVTKLSEMIDELMFGKSGEIDCIQIVGNPTMIYLLAGLDAKELGVAPYTIAHNKPFSVNAKDIGFPYSVPVLFPGAVSAFFGSDITCGMAATVNSFSDERFIYADLGTNGEIAVSDGKRIICCSTAVGPAFEGTNISYGTGAIEGAVCHVEIRKGEVFVSTVANKKPIGICGSGIIDTVAEMLRNGYVDFSGRISDSVNQPYKLCDGVFFEQKDVREIQLAKSAFRAGLEVLIQKLGLSCNQIDKVYISGGFGSFIDIRNCVEIGMFPDISPDCFVSLGNAAVKGAVSMVHSKEFFDAVEKLREKMEYIELFDSKDFHQKYIEFMMFGEE